jgi:hypothetical protein
MVDSWSIKEYDLYLLIFISKNTWDRPLSSLRTRRYSADTFSDEGIEEGRLSGIGSADDGDVSDFRHREGWIFGRCLFE